MSAHPRPRERDPNGGDPNRLAGEPPRGFAHGRSVVDKTTYQRECWLRHPQLQADLLTFHRKFPPLFRRSHQHAPRYMKTPPAWLTEFFEFKEPLLGYLAVVPRTFKALTQLHSV